MTSYVEVIRPDPQRWQIRLIEFVAFVEERDELSWVKRRRVARWSGAFSAVDLIYEHGSVVAHRPHLEVIRALFEWAPRIGAHLSGEDGVISAKTLAEWESA